MANPVTTVEVLLQQIADSLVEITSLLRQGPAAQVPDASASTSSTARPAVKKPPVRKK